MLPELTDTNRHFWSGGRDGKLHVLTCLACQRLIHPFAGRCPRCGSASIAPRPVSGRGTVRGVTINHQQWIPEVPAPYVVALVSLAEQDDIRLLTNMPRTAIERVHVGMPVKVYFEQHGDIFLPLFEEDDAA